MNNNFLTALNECFDEDCLKVSSTSYPEYELSKEFQQKMNKLIRQQKKVYYPVIKTTGRRIAAAIIAAVMMGSVTAVAYEPAREAIKEFFMKHFGTHDVVETNYVIENIDVNSSYYQKIRIEEEYEIAVPDGFELEEYYNDDCSINCRYSNGEDYIRFEQYPAGTYSANYDNEHHIHYNYTDDEGQEYLVYESTKSTNLTFIWNDGQYVFEISSNLDKEDIVDLCKSTKIKEIKK